MTPDEVSEVPEVAAPPEQAMPLLEAAAEGDILNVPVENGRARQSQHVIDLIETKETHTKETIVSKSFHGNPPL